MDGIMTGLAMLSGLGLPQILLWLLTFAIVFDIAMKIEIFGKSKAAPLMIAIVSAFLVLMATPMVLISSITSMSNTMVLFAVAALFVISILDMLKVRDHKIVNNAMLLVGLLLIAYMFLGIGGGAIAGIVGTIPYISFGTLVLLAAVGAVYWMVAGKPTDTKKA